MNKKGFTLVEIIGVITLIAVISLIAMPPIINQINKKKADMTNSLEQEVYAGANLYVNDNTSLMRATTCVKLSTLVSGEYLDSSIYDYHKTDDRFNENEYVKIVNDKQNDDGSNHYTYELTDTCNSIETITDAVLNNFPELELGDNGCKNPDSTKNYTYMGGCYLYGTQTKNYLWYSGFLWRIMGINSDNTIRLITETGITSISADVSNSVYSVNFSSDYIHGWLNDYFYSHIKDTYIKSSLFCQGAQVETVPSRTTCDGGNTFNANAGLITIDEYELSGATSSYLNNAQSFATMSPSTKASIGNYNRVWSASSTGSTNLLSLSIPLAVRPVISIDSTTKIASGSGDINSNWSNTSSPFILKDDGTSTTTLKDKATSGEYVKFADKTYRVVSKDASGNTKLILDGYYQETAGTNTKIAFGTNNTFSTTTGIGLSLNTTVLDWLIPSTDTTNRNKLVNYTWYQTEFDDGMNYTISLDETSPTRTIQAYVGLIRVGEMLSSQSYTVLTKNISTASDTSNVDTYWTLTPTKANLLVTTGTSSCTINKSGSMNNYDVLASDATVKDLNAIRPVIVVNNTTEIISGTGTPTSPYQI